MIKIELVQASKLKFAEIQDMARRFGFSVEYCIFNKRPIAIFNYAKKISDGDRLIVKENINRVNDGEQLCMANGDIVRWSQFIFRRLKQKQFSDFDVYRVV